MTILGDLIYFWTGKELGQEREENEDVAHSKGETQKRDSQESFCALGEV